jgi:hypothetical protein
MNTSIADVENGRIQDVLREANRLWRRRSVRGVDRAELLDELEAELAGAQRDGHGLNMVLGDDASQTVRQLADERRLSGRALRLGLVVPASFVGMVAGLAVVLLLVFGGFSNRWSFDPGPFVLPLYASAGLLAYLCALLCVWFVGEVARCTPSSGGSSWKRRRYRSCVVEKLQHQFDRLWGSNRSRFRRAWRNCRPCPVSVSSIVVRPLANRRAHQRSLSSRLP